MRKDPASSRRVLVPRSALGGSHFVVSEMPLAINNNGPSPERLSSPNAKAIEVVSERELSGTFGVRWPAAGQKVADHDRNIHGRGPLSQLQDPLFNPLRRATRTPVGPA